MGLRVEPGQANEQFLQAHNLPLRLIRDSEWRQLSRSPPSPRIAQTTDTQWGYYFSRDQGPSFN